MLSVIALTLSLASIQSPTGTTWVIPHSETRVQMDGLLTEWQGFEAIEMAPDRPYLVTEGQFGQDDLKVVVRSVWTRQGLHVALRWEDDAWDVEEIRRSNAIWVDSDGKRRNKMYYFDNLRLEMRRKDFHYTLWISPRADGRGPFHWTRMFGKNRLEVASTPPLISLRSEPGVLQMEWLFRWQDLRLKPKDYDDLRFRIEVADSDQPGRSLEGKMESLKLLTWGGSMSFAKK